MNLSKEDRACEPNVTQTYQLPLFSGVVNFLATLTPIATSNILETWIL